MIKITICEIMVGHKFAMRSSISVTIILILE